LADLPFIDLQRCLSASNGVHCQTLETLFRGARFGGHAAGFSGIDVSMSDADPGLTSWGPGKHGRRRILDRT
jgi:hypothetical protein